MGTRIIKTFLFIAFLIPVFLYSSAVINNFYAERDESGSVILYWTTTDESVDLSCFEIERKTSTTSQWIKIGEKQASGPADYTFIDKSIFKTNQYDFTYRLVMINQNGDALPYHIEVTVAGSSGIKHTWGSIKAMFR